jgi:hypothetical protein
MFILLTMGVELTYILFDVFSPQGAFAGGLTGLVVMGCISFGTQYAKAKGQIKHPWKKMSIAGCYLDPTESPLSSLAPSVFDTIAS